MKKQLENKEQQYPTFDTKPNEDNQQQYNYGPYQHPRYTNQNMNI